MYTCASFWLWQSGRGTIKMITPGLTSYICDSNNNWRLWLVENPEMPNDAGFDHWNKSWPLGLHFINHVNVPSSTTWLNHVFGPWCMFLCQLLHQEICHLMFVTEYCEKHGRMTPIFTGLGLWNLYWRRVWKHDVCLQEVNNEQDVLHTWTIVQLSCLFSTMCEGSDHIFPLTWWPIV
jgi:hypothetical protein